MFLLLTLITLSDAEGKPQHLSQSQMWGLMGLGVALLIYLAVIRPMMRRKDPLEKPSAFASLSQQRSVERQMQNLLVELSEMARQVSAQLDTRSAKLEVLIKEADQKIAALSGATTSAGASDNGSVHPQAASDSIDPPIAPIPSAPPAGQEVDPRHAEVYALADQGRDAGDIASELGRPRGEVELILALRNQ